MSERYNEGDHADVRELGKVLHLLQQASAEARRELGRRKEKARLEFKQRLVVSDHAVVRYLEREKGMDIEAIRAELSDIADAGERFKNIEDAVWSAEHRLVLIVDDGMVVTVLSEQQSDKYIGRKLRSGDRAGGEELAQSEADPA